MTVVTRFAPSPTGYLHIGGARTALFNWLFAKHHGGRFLLRIEDTDRARSTEEATAAIFDGLRWMGLQWDGDPVSQFSNLTRHQDVAHELLASGNAYRCYCTPDELAEMREVAKKSGSARLYDGRWRDRDPSEAPTGVDPVIRLKAPLEGETVIEDLVQGQVRIANSQLDDMVLLRADGTPTYMLAVVVDDHDMEITHVIRGDDHLTNAFRQTLIYQGMGWRPPEFAHIPLIHGADGAKMSKRHGALGAEAYRDQGFLPEALRNYLLRLGWGHGDEEIISTNDAIQWFSLDGVGRAAARFDLAKLTAVNAHYIRQAENERLRDLVMAALPEILDASPVPESAERLLSGMEGLKARAKTVKELAEGAAFYARARPLPLAETAVKFQTEENRIHLQELSLRLAVVPDWSEESVDAALRAMAEEKGLKLGVLAQPLRAALSGSNVSPGIFEVMAILGREETLGRIADFVAK